MNLSLVFVIKEEVEESIEYNKSASLYFANLIKAFDIKSIENICSGNKIGTNNKRTHETTNCKSLRLSPGFS